MKNRVTGQLKKIVSKIVFERGENCFKKEEGQIKTLLADKKFITVEADYMEQEKVIRTSITVIQKSGKYVESGCSCIDYNQRKNICKHIVALGILADRTRDEGQKEGKEKRE